MHLPQPPLELDNIFEASKALRVCVFLSVANAFHKISQQSLDLLKTIDMAENRPEKLAADVSSEEQAERVKRLNAMQMVDSSSLEVILGHCTKLEFKGVLRLETEGRHLQKRLCGKQLHAGLKHVGGH